MLPVARGLAFILASAAPIGAGIAAAPQAGIVDPRSEAASLFEVRVRPLLLERCASCHSGAQPAGGLRVDSRDALVKGGSRGPAVIPGDPAHSLLVQAVQYDTALKMPPAGKLPAAEIAVLQEWVRAGAPWPLTPSASTTEPLPHPDRRTFWSFRPISNPPPPIVRHADWAQTPIDRFILAGLEQRGLSPAPPADRRTLIRRATFDLTGLPPTPAEVAAFVADRRAGAFARVVDRLLASPRFGERWARHWLDVVRYADCLDARGQGGEGDISEAWRYRDWVVNALNADMPYDQFVQNQIAGDLLPGPIPGDINVRGTIATGMLAIGNWGNGDADKDKILTDIADDQVDVVSRGFMGLTVACARCHDHKFDPISTRDYYGLAGIFFSTHILPKLTPKGAGETPLRIPLLTAADRLKRERYAADLDAAVKRLASRHDAAYARFAASLSPQAARYARAAWICSREPELPASAVNEYAVRHGLLPFALRQWIAFLGLDRYHLLSTPAQSVLGNTGVDAWHGAPDPPSVTVNRNAAPRTILTFTLPARSLCVHPGPSNGVVIRWRSPAPATVTVAGRVTDADPACGDGIAWAIDLRTAGGARELASGAFPNGGAQSFSESDPQKVLSGISVRAGDCLELVVLPKADYGCDTTVVDLRITAADGSQWDVTRDVVDSFIAGGNPHSDSYGRPGVWSFLGMADGERALRVTGLAALAVARWQASVGQDAAHLEPASAQLVTALSGAEIANLFRVHDAADDRDLPADARAGLAEATAALESLRKSAPPAIEYANGAQDGGVPESPHAGTHDVRVHIRGSYQRLGDLVPRHFPVVLAGASQPPITTGSGRLELARWLVSSGHPLTARVIVNRIWQHLFGEGIVRTPSNFGWLGERPTHPELLDWLAYRFKAAPPNAYACGWSIKRLIRLVMLSSVYQQSAEGSAKAMRIDPDNRYLARMTRTRLEAEAIRDNMLAVAGTLDTTMGGKAVADPNTPRRTLYIMTVRSDRTGFGPLFDSADSTASVDRRTVSTVAPQALYLLNNQFVLDQANALAGRLLAARPEGDDRTRISRAYELLFARPPTPSEAQIGLAFLARQRVEPSVRTAATNSAAGDATAWANYCQVLLCTNEFVFVD